MKFGMYGDRLFVPYLHAPGGRWTGAVRDYSKQVFSLQRGHSGELFHFDVARLLELIAANDTPPFHSVVLVSASLEKAEVEFVAANHGIEDTGLARLTPERLEEPGILCEFGDGSSALVDGNHRYVRRFREGHETMQFWLLTREQWRLSLLDIPAEPGKQMAMRGQGSPTG